MILQREREIRAGVLQPIEELRSARGMVRISNSIQDLCLFCIIVFNSTMVFFFLKTTEETDLIELSMEESIDLARHEIDAEIATLIDAGRVYESTFYKIDATRAGIFPCFSSSKLCQDLLDAENSFFLENFLRVRTIFTFFDNLSGVNFRVIQTESR